MLPKLLPTFGIASVAILACASAGRSAPQGPEERTEPAVAATEDDFATKLWTALQGYRDWKLTTDVYPGKDPHGDFLRMYATWVHVGDEYHPVIVKENFVGDSREAVEGDLEEALASVTVMVQRQDGYSDDHGGWYWVKYQPDGSVAKAPDGKAVAGQVDSCVRCHDQAEGHDYLFHNDG